MTLLLDYVETAESVNDDDFNLNLRVVVVADHPIAALSCDTAIGDLTQHQRELIAVRIAPRSGLYGGRWDTSAVMPRTDMCAVTSSLASHFMS